MRVQLSINIMQAENGYVLTINAAGAAKQFIGTDFAAMKKTLAEFVSAMEEPKKPATLKSPNIDSTSPSA